MKGASGIESLPFPIGSSNAFTLFLTPRTWSPWEIPNRSAMTLEFLRFGTNQN